MTKFLTDILQLIADLISFLSKNSLHADEVVAKLGRAGNDPGYPMPIEIISFLPEVESAWLARYQETDIPYVLSLRFAEEVKITPADLTTLLGKFEQIMTNKEGPQEIIYYRGEKETSWEIAVIAEIDKNSGAIETSRINNIRFRRDHAENESP